MMGGKEGQRKRERERKREGNDLIEREIPSGLIEEERWRDREGTKRAGETIYGTFRYTMRTHEGKW